MSVGLSNVDLAALIDRLVKPIAERGLRVVLEPGKGLVSDAGLLVARVQNVKKVQVPVPGSGECCGAVWPCTTSDLCAYV